jgi:hypothetical protein
LRAADYANSTYQWKSTGNNSVLSPNRELNVSKPGVYVLKVTTTQSCSAYDTVIVATILPANIQIDTFPATHCDSANARIQVNVGSPGSWVYKLDSTHWTSNPSFSRLSAGLYKISIAPAQDTTCMMDTLIRIGSREKCIEICQGDSVLIGKPGLNAWCMKWDPETGVRSPNSSSTWVKPTSNVTYRLYLTDDEGNILDSLVYNITICPELIINHDTLNLCDQVNATLLVSGGVGPYLWKDQAGQVVATGTEFSPTLPGRYTVTQANGLVLPKSVWVIKDILNRDLDIESPLPSLCNDSLVLSAAGNFQQYSWKNQQGALLSSSNSMVVREPGTYTLVGGIIPGCQLEKSIKIEKTPFFIKLEQTSDTLDIADYQTPSDFYHNLSGIGEQILGLNSPEGKTFIVSINKGCFECGVVTIEVKDSLLNPSDKCNRVVHRKWIARNDCGRKSVSTQNLVLRDEQLPKFLDFPKDSLTVKCGSKLPDEVPLATDNSGRRVKVVLFKTEKIGRRSCDTLVIRHWRAIDSCGNDSIRKQFILIKGVKEKLLGVANPHQCGVPYQEPAKSQVLRQSLQADDVIWMYGFPVKIWDVTGGNGIFSGNGLLTLPFKQEAVKVTFADIRVNEDGKVIAGSMQAVKSAKGGNFKCRTLEKVEYCPTYTSRQDSIANEQRQAANGFKNCLWQGKTPPGVVDFDRKYDPYGFDCNGNHRNGGTTNEFGCTQAQMNDPKDSKCYGKIAPWSWLTAKDTLGPATEAGTKFADAIKDSLGIFVLSGLDELIIELEEEESEQISICANLRRETSNAFKALGLADSSYVFGSKGQYIKAGMWRQFLNEPKVISLNASRVAGMEVLETKHVELFACDKKQEEIKLKNDNAKKLEQERNRGELIKWLTDLVRRLPEDSVRAFQDREKFKAWIKRHVQVWNEQRSKTTLASNAQPGGFYQKEAPSRGALKIFKPEESQQFEHSTIVSAGLNHQVHNAKVLNALDQGNIWVDGVHRAFYLQDIVQQKSQSFFGNGENAKDTGAVLLPLAIEKEVGGKKYAILLDNITFDANAGGKLDAFLILPVPGGSGDSIVFQALNVPFTPGGANFSSTRLVLKCDAPIRINDVAQLKILANNETYIEWDCEGFKNLSLAAEVEFCRNVLVPYGTDLKPAPDSVKLKATLSSKISAWDDVTFGVTFSHTFGISEEGGVLFNVTDAYLDMSDTKTPPTLTFPSNYPFVDANSRNLWKGFYIKQFSIYLPSELDKSKTPRGVTLSDMIIDDGGVSVVVSLPGPVIPLSDGNLDGWAFSIDSVLVKILRNKFSGAGFGGLINIPILSSSQGSAITPEDCVRYTATIEQGGRYTFAVQPATSKRIGMWFADVTLEKSSSVQVSYANKQFTAQAILNGQIKINTEEAGINVNIPELRFQGLKVSNRAPYFDPGVWDRPGDALGVKANFDGFALGVDSINVIGGDKPGLGFRARLDIDLENGGFYVVGGFKMKGRLDVSTGRQRWLPDGLEVNQFRVNGEVKGILKVGGFVDFFKDNPKFGNGFWGGLEASLLFKPAEGAGLKAVALFGKTKDPGSYKYFMVDVMGLLPSASPSLIKGFGGGVWNRMSARDTAIVLSAFKGNVASFPIGQSLSGIKYEPSPSAGLGIKAAMLLGAGEGTFNAMVTLSAQFNNGGGLNELRLTGVGTLLDKPETEGQLSTAGKAITAAVSLKYSFSEKAFDGLLQVDVKVPTVTAKGDAKFHFSGEKWFVHLGTPQNPIRAVLEIPLVKKLGGAKFYLDIGSELPPPASLPSYFREMGITGSTSLGPTGTTRSGVMLGLAVDVDADFEKLKPIYAYLETSLGLDLAMVNYGNYVCPATGSRIGINGWYASGQIYAYLKASVGLKFKNKPFPIAELAAGAMLQGKAPNPTFARGAIGGSFRILGGLVKGKFNLQFTIGKDCGGEENQVGSEQSLDQNYEVIEALLPTEGTQNVPTTTAPSASFRFPLNGTLESYSDTGDPISYFVELDGAPILMEMLSEAKVSARAILSSDGRSLRFQPYDALKDSTRYVFIVKVKYSKNGVLIGQQEKRVLFTTGAKASNISAANIAASYPFNGMKHFYPGEYSNEDEFIELVQGQPDLFKGANTPKAILLGASGGQLWQGNVQYSLSSNRISFNFPNDVLRPGQCYTLEIRRLAQAATRAADDRGNGNSPGLLTSISFCTSNYTTFAAKVQAFAQQGTTSMSGHKVLLSGSPEAFDQVETGGNFGGKGWVSIETPFENNTWYQAQKSALYKQYSSPLTNNSFRFSPRRRNGAGVEQAITWQQEGKTLQFEVIEELLADFDDFRSQVTSYEAELKSNCDMGRSYVYAPATCTDCCVLPEFIPVLKLVSSPIPPNVTYGIRLRYTPPGKSAGSSASIPFNYQTSNPNVREQTGK